MSELYIAMKDHEQLNMNIFRKLMIECERINFLSQRSKAIWSCMKILKSTMKSSHIDLFYM